MPDEPRQQPVAIRVTRPYSSPDEFLEHELETLTRTSVTLIGAQPRPKGVILRFEVALTGGGQLLRGEGRVVGFKENALGDQPGLVLRFTRLDTKSKALVDRAATIREGRARAALQAAMGEDSLVPGAHSPPTSSTPGSLAPHSIGPMSVPTMPSSREPALVPVPRTEGSSGSSLETPRFERGLPSSRPVSSSGTSSRPDPSTQSTVGGFSFDESTFSSPPDAPELPPAAPTAASSRPDVPTPPPSSSPTVADERWAARVSAAADRFPQPSAPPPPLPVMPARASSTPRSTSPAVPPSSSQSLDRSASSPPPLTARGAPAPLAPSAAPAPPLPFVPSAGHGDREPLLSRLRERARELSADRLSALVRR